MIPRRAFRSLASSRTARLPVPVVGTARLISVSSKALAERNGWDGQLPGGEGNAWGGADVRFEQKFRNSNQEAVPGYSPSSPVDIPDAPIPYASSAPRTFVPEPQEQTSSLEPLDDIPDAPIPYASSAPRTFVPEPQEQTSSLEPLDDIPDAPIPYASSAPRTFVPEPQEQTSSLEPLDDIPDTPPAHTFSVPGTFARELQQEATAPLDPLLDASFDLSAPASHESAPQVDVSSESQHPLVTEEILVNAPDAPTPAPDAVPTAPNPTTPVAAEELSTRATDLSAGLSSTSSAQSNKSKRSTVDPGMSVPVPKLSEEEVKQSLPDQWLVRLRRNGALSLRHVFSFESYDDGFAFLSQMALYAAHKVHHPDMQLRPDGKVTVETWTHVTVPQEHWNTVQKGLAEMQSSSDRAMRVAAIEAIQPFVEAGISKRDVALANHANTVYSRYHSASANAKRSERHARATSESGRRSAGGVAGGNSPADRRGSGEQSALQSEVRQRYQAGETRIASGGRVPSGLSSSGGGASRQDLTTAQRVASAARMLNQKRGRERGQARNTDRSPAGEEATSSVFNPDSAPSQSAQHSSASVEDSVPVDTHVSSQSAPPSGTPSEPTSSVFAEERRLSADVDEHVPFDTQVTQPDPPKMEMRFKQDGATPGGKKE